MTGSPNNLDSIRYDEFFHKIDKIDFRVIKFYDPFFAGRCWQDKERNTESLKSNEKNESPVNPNYSTISLLILSLLSLSLFLFPFLRFYKNVQLFI